MDTGMRTFGLVLFCMVLFSSSFAQAEMKKAGKIAPLNIYSGGVQINKVAGTIELQDGMAPKVNLSVGLKNDSTKGKNISVGFRSTDTAKVTLKKQAGSTLQLSPKVMHKGVAGKVQMATMDLTMLLDGLLPDKPVSEIDIKITLPANTKKIIRSNMELSLAKEGGKNVYYLRQNGKYTGRLKLVYTTGPVLIDIRKAISPAKITKGNVDVTLIIKNEGSQVANNVLLEDNYDPRDFSAEGEGFSLYKGEVNDSRLIWRKLIPSLAVGETKTITYKLKANYDVTHTKLSAATASINKELVGVSNKVRLKNN